MKLNPDCVRTLVLFIEEHTYVSGVSESGGKFHKLSPQCMIQVEPVCSYDADEVLYTLIQLSESGYIVTDFSLIKNSETDDFLFGHIYYLTPKGHEFASGVRRPERWNKIKAVIKPIGDISLSALTAIAQGVTEGIISNALSLPQ